MRIVSLNLRYAHSAEMNNQGVREPRIVDFVDTVRPDSLGVQECEKFWLDRLAEKLGALGYAPAQPEAYSEGGRYAFKNYIWYDTAKWELAEGGSMWLSGTPDVPSRDFGSRFFISAGWAVLECRETGKCVAHINTHLDVSSSEIRLKEIEILKGKADQLSQKGYPVFITGDFNSEENSDEYARMSEGLLDARYTAASSTQLNTFNGYSVEGTVIPKDKYKRIDYCFYNGNDSGATVDSFEVIDRWKDAYMSDHNAVIADVKI